MVVDNSLVYYYDFASDLCLHSTDSDVLARNLARLNEGDDALDLDFINCSKSTTISLDKSRYLYTDGTNDYLRSTLSNNPNINTRDNITVGAWCKLLNGSSWGIVSKYSQYILGLNSLDRPAFLVYVQSAGWLPSGYNGNIWGDDSIDISEWHYWVGTYNKKDGSGGETKLYCDGNLLSTNSIPAGFDNGRLNNDSGEFKLMKRDGSGNYQRGGIAIAHCYNRVLSAEEIRQNYISTRGRFQ